MFPIQTHVTWTLVGPGALTELQNEEILAHANDLQNQEKTNNNLAEHDRTVTDQVTTTRFWIDLATAEAWISFLQPYNPISTSITTEN